MARPVGPRADVADRPNLGAWYRWRPAARYAQDIVAARGKATAHRIADKSRCAGHQNARQHDPPIVSLRPDGASNIGANALKRRRSQRKTGSTRESPRSRTVTAVAIAVGDDGRAA